MDLNTVYLGDCLELIPKHIDDKSIDMIFCDLPYGTTKCKWDIKIDLSKLWLEYKRILKPNGIILLFAQTPFDKVLGSSNIEWLKYEWIWEKTQATGFLNSKKMPMKAHENILVFYNKLPKYNPQKTNGHNPVNNFKKRVSVQNKSEVYGETKTEIIGGGNTDRYPRSVLKFSSDKQKSKLHPTQKPLALIEYLIKTYTDENDIVLDNCAGSGTVGVAAKNTNRNYILMELEEKYYNITNKRMNYTLDKD